MNKCVYDATMSFSYGTDGMQGRPRRGSLIYWPDKSRRCFRIKKKPLCCVIYKIRWWTDPKEAFNLHVSREISPARTLVPLPPFERRPIESSPTSIEDHVTGIFQSCPQGRAIWLHFQKHWWAYHLCIKNQTYHTTIKRTSSGWVSASVFQKVPRINSQYLDSQLSSTDFPHLVLAFRKKKQKSIEIGLQCPNAAPPIIFFNVKSIWVTVAALQSQT